MQQDRRSTCVMDFFDMDLPGKEVCNRVVTYLLALARKSRNGHGPCREKLDASGLVSGLRGSMIA